MLSLALHQKFYSPQVVLYIIRTFDRLLHLWSIIFLMDGLRTYRLVIDEAFAKADSCDYYPNSRLHASTLSQHIPMVLRQQR